MATAILNIECVPGVYRIQNTENGKFYIGSSVNIRWRAHKHLSHLRRGIHANAHLQAAFNKYGEQAFSVELVEVCDKADLLNFEQRHLDQLAPDYNICRHAANTLGYRHTAESKAKMAVHNKGNQRNLGNKHSEQTKRLIGELASQRRHSDEAKAKIAKAGIGNKNSLGRKLPPEHVAKVAAASLNMWNGSDSENRRKAASDRAKARWADPAWRSANAAKIKAGKAASKPWPMTTQTDA